MTLTAHQDHLTAAGVGPRLLAAAGPDLQDHLAAFGPLAATDRRIIELVGAAGLRGRGGAGFPTALKLGGLASQPGRRVVVGNGTEGEPLSAKDATLITQAPHLVLDGLAVAASAVGAYRSIICVEAGRDDLVSSLGAAATERHDRIPVEIREAPARYVSGQESALVSWIGGAAAKPTGRRPDLSGIDGHPTLVDNVETLAHLALIARFGPGWYRTAGTPDEPGTRLVTVSGAVARGGVYEIPSGLRLSALLARAGAGTVNDGHASARETRAVLLGGYYGRWVDTRPEQGDGAAALRLGSANLGAGVIVAIDDDHCAVHEVARVASWFAANSARQCGPCTFGLADLAAAATAVDIGRDGAAGDDLRRWTSMVRGRGACHLPDGAAGFIESALTVFAGELAEHRSGQCPRHRRALLPTPAPEAW